MDGVELFVYAGGCIIVAGMMFLAAVCLHLSLKLSNIIGDPVMFMLHRGWAQCTCCNCLTRYDRITHLDDYGGSGPGDICPACLVSSHKATLLYMLLGDGDRYFRVLDQLQRGTLTQASLELEVVAHIMPDYQPDRGVN